MEFCANQTYVYLQKHICVELLNLAIQSLFLYGSLCSFIKGGNMDKAEKYTEKGIQQIQKQVLGSSRNKLFVPHALNTPPPLPLHAFHYNVDYNVILRFVYWILEPIFFVCKK